MKQAILAFGLLMMAVSAVGCATAGHNACKSCNSCQACRGGGGGLGNGPSDPDYVARLPKHQYPQADYGPSGPPTAAYAYPYYTTRGPRDFLLDTPPSIGP